MTIVAERQFLMADQVQFAVLSGDWNPMHMSEEAARRTPSGSPAVHGVHATLWALDCLAASTSLVGLSSISARFDRFVHLNRAVQLRITKQSPEVLKAELVQSGQAVTQFTLKFGTQASERLPLSFSSPQWHHSDNPEAPTPDAMAEHAGWMAPPPTATAIRTTFPSLVAAIGEGRVIDIALTSTLVGMVCPGLHSIYSEATVSLVPADENAPGLAWRTRNLDTRFGLVQMQVEGSGILANIKALVRPSPVEQPGLASISGVDESEFSNRRALVVGGSRGLGAATAALLAKGGASVALTYSRGRDDAERLVADIRSERGESAASCLALDVTGDFSSQFAGISSAFTHVYYFATPRIGAQGKDFSRESFDEYFRFYVDAPRRLCLWLASEGRAKDLTLFYPSTIFVDERPRGMTEYAMAKAAGEIFFQDTAKALGFKLIMPRLPKILTDQTNGVLALEAANAMETMLPFLREG